MNEETAASIKEQLHNILSSQDFPASNRLKELLGFIVEKTVNNEEYLLKAYTLGVDVLGLGSGFDPRLNPVVRIEAARLRSKLDHYYLLNPEAPVYISIPKGGYVAHFSRREQGAVSRVPLQSGNPAFSGRENPDCLSAILLMPLDNISKTDTVEKFVRGLNNELNNALTKFHELKVIDGTTPLANGGLNGAETGHFKKSRARFVLNGSVQLENSECKVWISLIDSSTNYNMWAEKFSANLNDVSAYRFQESIAEAVIRNISDEFGLISRTLLTEYARAGSGFNLTQQAYLLYWHWTTMLTRETFESALQSVETAAAEEPEHIPTQAMLADMYASDWEGSYDLIPNNLERSLRIAARAINAAPDCQQAHLAMSLNYYLRNDHENFRIEAARTLKLNPESGNAQASIASWYGCLGMWDEALAILDKFTKLNPAWPGWCHSTLSLYRYVREDYENALQEARKINAPEVLWDPLFQLLAHIGLKDQKSINTARQKLLKTFPDIAGNNWDFLRRYLPLPEYQEMVIADLKKIGIN